MTGTPVREWRRGGMIVVDWVGGERIRRRRGLEMVLALGLVVFAAGLGAEEAIGGDRAWVVWIEGVWRVRLGSEVEAGKPGVWDIGVRSESGEAESCSPHQKRNGTRWVN